MKLTHGDPQYLVLYDEHGTPICTCVSIEARDRLIEAVNGGAAAEARADHLADERIELQGRIALAVEALDCCSSCVRTWLIGELDDEQRSLVVQEQSRVAARAERGE